MKIVRPIAILGLGIALTLTSAAAASAYTYDQEGQSTPGTLKVDGTTVDITPSSFNPVNQQCVLYAAIISDVDSGGNVLRHIETGVVRCNNYALINAACSSGHTFSEKYTGSGYDCAIGSTFTNGSTLNAMIQRTAGTDVMWGSTGGSYMSQAGFTQGHDIRATAWAEATGVASVCPTTPHSAHFANWKKYTNSGGWSTVSAPWSYRSISGITNAPCWSVGSVSGGAFDVA